MYAELSFPSGGGQYSTATFSSSKPESTMYAQVHHSIRGAPISMAIDPVNSSGNCGIVMSPAGGLMGSNMEGTVTGVMFDRMVNTMGNHMADSILEMGLGMCSGSSMVMDALSSQEAQQGDLDSLPYTTLMQPPHGFGGRPPTPLILSEEDEQTTVERPLINNHKESEV